MERMSAVKNLFNIHFPSSRGESRSPGPSGHPFPAELSVGVFVTPQSMATFPGASAAVLVAWHVLDDVFALPHSKVVLLAVSLLVGFLIFLMSETRGMTPRQKFIAAIIAFINSLLIAASALGIDVSAGHYT